MVLKSSNSDTFSNINPVKTPRGLFRRIIIRLGLEKSLKITKKHLIISSFAFLFSCGLLILAIGFLKHELLESEFGPIISLSISDTRAVLAYAGEFTLAFLESIPVFYITILLAAIMLLLVGMKFVLRYAGKMSLLLKSMHK
jgi:hypothetical protein